MNTKLHILDSHESNFSDIILSDDTIFVQSHCKLPYVCMSFLSYDPQSDEIEAFTPRGQQIELPDDAKAVIVRKLRPLTKTSFATTFVPVVPEISELSGISIERVFRWAKWGAKQARSSRGPMTFTLAESVHMFHGRHSAQQFFIYAFETLRSPECDKHQELIEEIEKRIKER